MSYHKSGGYKSGGYKNNSGGATMPKSGMHYAPLCRKAGMAQAMACIDSRTKSRYTGSRKHNHYEGSSGYGDNENILGYNPE